MTQPQSLDLLPSEVEADVRAAVRELLVDRCEPPAVIAMYDGDRSLVDPLWRALTRDLDLAGLLVPEDRGGVGASARDAAAVADELGRFVAPVPFLTSAVMATTALLGSDSELLSELAAGTRTAALLVPLSIGPQDPPPMLSLDDDGRVTGTVPSVAGALEADVLLALVGRGTTTSLWAIEAAAATITPVVSLDMTRQLADVTIDGAGAVMVVEDGASAVSEALRVGAAVLAAEQVGIAQWCLAETVGYLKMRTQFGRVLGSFQALKHRLADLYIDVEGGAAAAANATAAIAEVDPDAAVATAVAQSWCSDLAVRAAEETIQLHGGIGMTWEHPAHLYLKRAKADQIALGTPGAHRTHLAGLINLAGPAATPPTADR